MINNKNLENYDANEQTKNIAMCGFLGIFYFMFLNSIILVIIEKHIQKKKCQGSKITKEKFIDDYQSLRRK